MKGAITLCVRDKRKGGKEGKEERKRKEKREKGKERKAYIFLRVGEREEKILRKKKLVNMVVYVHICGI